MMLTVLICAAKLAFQDCTEANARSIVHIHVDSIGCSTPATIAMTTGINGVDDNEYTRIKCRIGR